ncbi:MAG TPA: methyltransferase domain-containing protein [Kiritimatiellia bacterium]|jgi:SAM-dependent methyltransferase|nr:methyltransferase domain-containing protein [Kiritimatiellia bacterium]HOR97676.1 methyltransferase domain-containing protein [Kiritimatiellia bacterium]HPW74823.1 methyltransferase domain-containing protein [Kiritimatiellia bacterium]HRU18727.1 methyltransferase domain-containing protein [Kiritimatiellia bacterium]
MGNEFKLNLGCGEKVKSGYVNVDACGQPDFLYDLTVFPWPWEDATVDEVCMEHFLEHVPDYDRTVREIHRILKTGGVLRFTVPHFRNPMAAWHLHCNQFSVYTPELLCEQRAYQWGGRVLFEKISLRIRFVWITPWLGRILSFFANRAPLKWDWLGLPIDEIEFVGRKK